MKIPKDKLPLNIGHKLHFGQYAVICKHPKPGKFITGKFAGQIAYKDLSKYVVKAANEFPEAIELLNRILNYYKLDSEDYSDGEILDLIKQDIEQFLNSLENEEG